VSAPPSGRRTGSTSTHSVDIYAFTGHGNPAAIVRSLPRIVDGVSWIFSWRDIEKTQGVYDWSAVDAAIAASAGSGRKTMLRIIAGASSPSWVPNQLTFSFMPLGPPHTVQTITMPRTWDPTYVADWKTFIQAYGAHIDGDSRVTKIQMTGGGWQGEMTLPQWPGWIGAGYTDALITNTWEQFIAAYRTAFPRHTSVLDFGEPLTVYYHSHVLPTVLAYAETYGAAVDYQQNGLTSGTKTTGGIFQTLLALSKTTKVGWQMIGGNGSSGNLMTAFSTAIKSGASYAEVYLNDILNPSNAAALAYLASGGS
jgi:hypothetical protein